MKPVLIKQPAGLGDILFCQKIAYAFMNKGHRVIWPVCKAYHYIGEYIINGPEFINLDDEFQYKHEFLSCSKGRLQEYENCIVLATDGAEQAFPGEVHRGVMKLKYLLTDLDYGDWSKYVTLKRNAYREEELINFVGVKTAEKYIVVNSHFGTPPECSMRNMHIIPESNLPVVQVELYDNFRPFDWLSILEKAEEVHTVETSFCYLLELINKEKVFIYPKQTTPCNGGFSYDYCNYYPQQWKYIS